MRKKSKLLILFLSVFTLSLLLSCESVIIVPIEIEVPVDLSFSNEIIPIFNNSCNMSGCHSAGFPILDLSPMNAFQDITDKGLVDLAFPEMSKLHAKLVESGSTHANRSTIVEQQLILEWIKQGAKDN